MSRFISVLIIPAIIICGSLIYFMYYKSSINRHLNDENYQGRDHNPAPVYIALGIAIISLLVNTSKNQLAISNLQNNVNNLSSQIYRLNEKIDELSKKDSTVYSYGLDLINLEKQNGQYVATVRVNVYPEMLQGETEFILRYENTSQVMIENNGVYSADIFFPCAQGGGSAVLSMTYNGKTQNDDIYLEGEKILGSLLPSMDVIGSSEISSNTFKADWTISAYSSETRKITDAVLLISDSKNTKEISLEDAVKNGQMELNIKEKISSGDKVNVEIQYHDDKGFTYTESIYSFDKPYHLEVTDSEGIQVIVL